MGLIDGKYCFQRQSTRNGTQIACVNADGNTVELNGYTRSPHSGLFSWPLTVGKEWEFSFTSTAKTTGGTTSWTKHVRVVSYGPVVAGGQSYMAFRIEAENHNLSGGYASHETLYYAPSIGKSVKYDGGRDFDSFELLSCVPTAPAK
jgi:hypothetical protein